MKYVIYRKVERKPTPRGNAMSQELLIASNDGDLTTVLRCIFEGEDVNESYSGPEVTPLHFAAARGFFEIAFVLFNNGADPYIPDNEGYTASEYAKLNGHHEIYELFTSRRGDHHE